MLTFRVELPYFVYDRESNISKGPFYFDSGLTFASPYGATIYARERFGRVVDEETDAEPAHGGVVDERTWNQKKALVDAGLRLEHEVDLGSVELEY